MSTRGRVVIISASHQVAYHYGIGTDAYPDRILPTLKDYSGDVYRIASLVDPYPAGNWDYWYEIDSDRGTLTTWEGRTRWANAPDDWEARGWHCWMNENTRRYGYHIWVKGKKLDTWTYPEPIPLLIHKDPRGYTPQDIRVLRRTVSCSQWWVRGRKAPSPDHTYTYLRGVGEWTARPHQIMYQWDRKELVCHLNDEHELDLIKWRLQTGK